MQNIILREIQQMLIELLKNDLHHLVLFGSQLTAHCRPDSDYDILIVLKKPYSYHLKRQILDICYQVCLKYNILIDAKIISDQELTQTLKGKLPIYTEALKNGIYA